MAERLVNDLSPLRPGFEPRSGSVGFVVYQVALGQVFFFLRVLRVSPASTIPPIPLNYLRLSTTLFYVLPTQCIYVFCVHPRTNSDYFPIQH